MVSLSFCLVIHLFGLQRENQDIHSLYRPYLETPR